MRWLLVFFAAVVSLFPRAAFADSTVIFNEIMYHPAANESAMEWVELHNQMAVDMDLSGWSLQGGIQYAFPAGTIIRGGGYRVVAISPGALAAATGLTNLLGPFLGRLSNSGERLELRNNNRRLMDWLNYKDDGDWPPAADGAGVSLAKVDPKLASSQAENWTASREIGGTPGARNFVLPGASPPESLVMLNSSWRYWTPATEPDASWNQLVFDDRAWPLGNALFFTGNPQSEPGAIEPIRTLFSSGLDNNRTRIAGGTPDPHFLLVASAQGTPPPPAIAATVIDNHPAWLGNDSLSSWLGPINPGTTDVAPGIYNYQTRFDLSGYDSGTAQITLQLAADNRINNVLLNGVSQGIQFVGFSSLSTAFTLRVGFVPGTNILDFLTANDATTPNPAGFRVQLSGTAAAQVPRSTGVAPGPITHYFRTPFFFKSDAASTQIKLRAFVDDGAIFYLNGVEVWRVNMPAGPVTSGTFASTNVTNATFSAFIPIFSNPLLPGTNILAVEVHQAPGMTNEMLFGAELVAEIVPGAAPRLLFNEASAATNFPFRVEFVNAGTNTVFPDRYVLALAGSTDRQYLFPNGSSIAPGDYLVLSEDQLGFHPLAGDKLLLFSPNRSSVLDAIVVETTTRVRFPDAGSDWFTPEVATWGSSNQVTLRRDVVINEIMYHPRLPTGLSITASNESRGSWIELLNRSANWIDLTGWSLDSGIKFLFPVGTVLPAGGLLVVAKDKDYLQSLYPALSVVGNFTNQLSRHSDLIILRDDNKNPVNRVRYFDSAPWPEFSDGGGSSIELIDPGADNSKAEDWRASDETVRSQWQTYTYQGFASATVGPTLWNEFVLGLLEAGEVLLDDLSVIENPNSAPRELLQNGSFQQGGASWRFLGNHRQSRVIADPNNPANLVLDLVASGPTEHIHNHVETTLTSGATIVNGREYRISFRARWLAGSRQLNTRLYFNRVAKTTVLDVPLAGGTPGARNSRQIANLGPTFASLRHEPLLPATGQPVSVSITANDPDGVAGCMLWWAADNGVWAQTSMAASNGTHFVGQIPGGAAGSRVQFYVEATDGLGGHSTFPATGRNSRALYGINDVEGNPQPLHRFRILMTPADADFLHAQTNVMSNEHLRATFLYDDQEVFYDAGIHLQGSERGRGADDRVGFTLYFPADHLFRGVHDSISIDRSGGWSGRGGRQDEIVMKHVINQAGGLPGMYDDIVQVLAPKPQHNGNALLLMAKYGDEFLGTQYANGEDGNLFKLELIYYPLSTVSGNAESPKLPQPDDVIGTDLRDLGNNPENYRWNLSLENNRGDDNYSNMVQVAKAFSLSGTALDTQMRQLLDVSEWMRVFAAKSLSGDADTYGFGYPHNFMVYFRPEDGKALGFIWDMDFAWANSPTAALIPGDNIGKLVRLPGNQRLFYGHLLDLIDTTYNPSYISYWTTHYGNLAGQNYSGILSYITQRGNFVRTQMPAQIPFTITSNAGADFMVSSPTVTLGGNAWINVKEIRIHGRETNLVFTWPSLQQWQVTLPVILGTNTFNFLAYDFRGNLVGTDQITVTSSSLLGGTDRDQDGIPDDWESAHGLNPNDRSDGPLDFDGDGLRNQEEYLAGTDPFDASSRLELRLTTANSLSFEAMPGRSYSIQQSIDLGSRVWNSWTNIAPAQTNRTFSALVPATGAGITRFFRLVTPQVP